MDIAPDIRDWLLAHNFVDGGVNLEAVRLHLEGPPADWIHWRKMGPITIGNDIWLAREPLLRDRDLITHELVHVGQYARMGRAAFLAQYAADLARAGFRYSEHLPLERPAHERQQQARAAQ